MTSRDGHAIRSSGRSIAFWYGTFRQRWTTQYSGPSGTETTVYAGKLIEKLIGGSVTDYRHHLFTGNELVAA